MWPLEKSLDSVRVYKVMDLSKNRWGGLGFALTVALMASSAWAQKTLWLVRPLYPGQEALVDRTEKALDKLMPGDSRQEAVIGLGELTSALKGKELATLPCFSADARCVDPIDPFIAGLGFERIVLIQGGQDEVGFKYRVVAYEPKLGKVSPASAMNASLERALLGAVAKVVPAASTLEVTSNPPRATVYVDDVKVGVTPLNTQVLPGERVVRVDLTLHQPVEQTVIIPIRGSAKLDVSLEKVAARIVISASPPGSEISIDGVLLGKDKVDRGIVPGEHSIRITAEGHQAYEQTLTIKPEKEYMVDETLRPLGNVSVKEGAVKEPGQSAVRHEPPPPPNPPTVEELTYERRSYFHVGLEGSFLLSPNFVARRFDAAGFGRTTQFVDNAATPMKPFLMGVSIEYGTFGKYFGMGVFGLSYLTNFDALKMNVGFEPGQSRESGAGALGPAQIERVRTHLVVIRALQPQVRIALWRFVLGIQLGLEFRTGQISGTDFGPGATAGATFYKDGFVPLDLMASGRFNVRFMVADGFFVHAQGNYTQYIIGAAAVDDAGAKYGSGSSAGFSVGVGYAF